MNWVKGLEILLKMYHREIDEKYELHFHSKIVKIEEKQFLKINAGIF